MYFAVGLVASLVRSGGATGGWIAVCGGVGFFFLGDEAGEFIDLTRLRDIGDLGGSRLSILSRFGTAGVSDVSAGVARLRGFCVLMTCSIVAEHIMIVLSSSKVSSLIAFAMARRAF